MAWLWWIIGTLGLGGALLAGAVVVFGWPVIIGTRAGRMALMIAGAAGAVLMVYLKGKREGRKAERNYLKRKTAKEVDHAEAESERIDGLSDGDIDRELLERWSHK